MTQGSKQGQNKTENKDVKVEKRSCCCDFLAQLIPQDPRAIFTMGIICYMLFVQNTEIIYIYIFQM